MSALVRVLGPVRLPAPDGGLVEPPGALPKRLVVALALAGTEGRSAAGLVEDVWDGDAPRNARAALQMLVSRTRAVAADGVLVSTASGYRIAASDLDAAERAARAATDRAALDEALALWQGEAGAELDLPELAEDLAARADRARARLLRARAALLADEGDTDAALADLDALDAPLDPAAVALRMRTLAAAGRTAEALAAFARHRERLADELGADPDPSLAGLNAELLRAAPGTVELVGVRAGATPLLGRDEDIARLTRDVAQHRVVSILGAGGLGKTRLAHEVAARAAGRFERVVFVELAGARAAADVQLVVGAAVGARVPQARRRLNDPLPPDLATRTREALAGRRSLLVLDNCEQVIDAVAALTADLIAQVPTLAVLTTTRVPLLVPGERVHALQPLEPATDAAELFRQRAAAARPDARLDDATVERICARLDGLPLAIELAAARLRAMTLDELDRRLADRFAVLVGGDRTAPERHRTLFAVIDWSWRLLTDDRRAALRRLAVFPDGFTADAASVLLEGDATEVLGDLVDQSLLVFTEGRDGSGRYRMLETVREFGLRALEDAGDAATARAGLDRFALAFCRAVAPGLTGGLDSSAAGRVATEEETLLTVLREPPEGREAVVVAVWAVLAESWIYRVEFERGPETLPLLLDAAAHRPASQIERDEALRALTLGAALATVGRAPGALRALALLRRLRRDLPADAAGFWPLFSGALFLQQTAAEALADLEAIAATSTDPLIATFTALISGQLLENAGRTRAALDAAIRGQRLAERHGYTWFRMMAGMNIAQLRSQRADRQEGLRLASTASAELDRLGLRTDSAQLDWLIAINEVALGRIEAAEPRFRRVVDAAERGTSADARDERSIGLAGLAEIAVARGDAAEAAVAWERATTAAASATVPWRLVLGGAALAAAVRLGQDPAAIAIAYRRLRGRVLALCRFPADRVDVPVLASAAVGLAAALQAPERTEAQRTTGAELVRLAVPLGARLDFPSLELAPGVRDARGVGDVEDRQAAVARIAALLREPAGRL